MKKTIFLSILGIFFAISLYAAEEPAPVEPAGPEQPPTAESTGETGYNADVLIKNKPKNIPAIGGFITPIFRYPIIGDNMNLLLGLRGAVLFDHHYAVGLTGYFMPSQLTNRELTGDNIIKQQLYLSYGGAFFEYYFFPDKIVHLSTAVLLGPGMLTDEFSRRPADNDGRRNYFLVLEPELNLYVNVTKHQRLGIGTSYRFTHGVRMHEVRDKDLRGFTVSLMYQIGMF